MKYLLLLALSACGGDYVVSGNVTVTHQIDLASESFLTYCQDEFPNDTVKQEECVAELTANFIKAFGDIQHES